MSWEIDWNFEKNWLVSVNRLFLILSSICKIISFLCSLIVFIAYLKRLNSKKLKIWKISIITITSKDTLVPPCMYNVCSYCLTCCSHKHKHNIMKIKYSMEWSTVMAKNKTYEAAFVLKKENMEWTMKYDWLRELIQWLWLCFGFLSFSHSFFHCSCLIFIAFFELSFWLLTVSVVDIHFCFVIEIMRNIISILLANKIYLNLNVESVVEVRVKL